MKRIFFAMMFGVLVFPGFSFIANAHERGTLSEHKGVAWVVGGGGSLHSKVIFFPHNPRVLVVPGSVYFLGGHHNGSSYSHFKERRHGPRIWMDTQGPFSYLNWRSHVHFDRGHHDHNKKHQRHSRTTRVHHYR